VEQVRSIHVSLNLRQRRAADRAEDRRVGTAGYVAIVAGVGLCVAVPVVERRQGPQHRDRGAGHLGQVLEGFDDRIHDLERIAASTADGGDHDAVVGIGRAGSAVHGVVGQECGVPTGLGRGSRTERGECAKRLVVVEPCDPDDIAVSVEGPLQLVRIEVDQRVGAGRGLQVVGQVAVAVGQIERDTCVLESGFGEVERLLGPEAGTAHSCLMLAQEQQRGSHSGQ